MFAHQGDRILLALHCGAPFGGLEEFRRIWPENDANDHGWYWIINK